MTQRVIASFTGGGRQYNSFITVAEKADRVEIVLRPASGEVAARPALEGSLSMTLDDWDEFRQAIIANG